MKYSKDRAVAQISAFSLKGAKLPVGTELTAQHIVSGELANGQPNDVLLCSTDKGNIRVPVRELAKMKVQGGGQIFDTEEGSSDVEIPGKFKIVAAEDRKDRQGETIFPVFAYNLAEAQLATGSLDWNALKAGGLKKDHGFDAVQNYTVTKM